MNATILTVKFRAKTMPLAYRAGKKAARILQRDIRRGKMVALDTLEVPGGVDVTFLGPIRQIIQYVVADNEDADYFKGRVDALVRPV
jgi:hypothetical protein